MRSGALLVAVFTDPVALGAVRSPGEMDADIVVGEGQGLGNALNFGGPYVGLFATRGNSCARCRAGSRARRWTRGSAQLRPDAVDARAAYPAREGDEQHLHEFGPLRARFLDPSVAARRDWIAAARRHQSRQRRPTRRARSPAFRASRSSTRISSTNSPCARRVRRRELVEALAAKGVIGGLPVSRLLPGAGLDDCIVVASTEMNTDEDRAAYAKRARQPA